MSKIPDIYILYYAQYRVNYPRPEGLAAGLFKNNISLVFSIEKMNHPVLIKIK